MWVLGIQHRTSRGAASSVKAEPSLQPQTQVLSGGLSKVIRTQGESVGLRLFVLNYQLEKHITTLPQNFPDDCLFPVSVVALS